VCPGRARSTECGAQLSDNSHSNSDAVEPVAGAKSCYGILPPRRLGVEDAGIALAGVF
jgi:hypothetical protein